MGKGEENQEIRNDPHTAALNTGRLCHFKRRQKTEKWCVLKVKSSFLVIVISDNCWLSYKIVQ